MRIFISLFIALMITTMGVVYLPLIEKPLEVYYLTDVTHTAQHYSYKPGQSGTTFEFYIKRSDTGYDQLPFLQTIGIPTLFYFGILLFLNLFWRLVRPKKIKERDERDQLNVKKQEFKKFTSVFKGKDRKSSKTVSLVLVLVIAALFFSARTKRFGLGTTETSLETTNIQNQFNPTHLAYAGGDLIWLIEVNRKGNGGYMIENENADKMDSVFYNIQCFNLKDSSYKEVDSYFLGRKDYQLEAIGADNQIWLIGRPNRLTVYDASNYELIYPNIQSFSDNFDDLSSGVNTCYKQSTPKDLLYIEAMDGTRHYYDFQSGQLEEKISLFTNDRQVFKLIKDRGAIYNIGKTSTFKNYSKISEEDLIDAEILFQDSNKVVVLHKSDISENAKTTISCFNLEGTDLWSLSENELPSYEDPEELIHTKSNYACAKFSDDFVITISSLLNSEGIISVDSETGNVNWSFTIAAFKTN